MDNPRLRIQGVGYLPGVAEGIVQRGLAGGGDRVSVLTHAEIGPLAECPAAVIIVEGAPFSHTTIVRRALGVPIVLVSAAQAGSLRDGDLVCVDGAAGVICSGPPAGTRAGPPPAPPAGQSLRTADGTAVDLHASVHAVGGAAAALGNGAMSVGLVRTEFLVPPAGLRPGRAYFDEAFAALCDAAAPLPVTFRLIDIAADKVPAWVPVAGRLDAAFGLQGARLYHNPLLREVVESQLEALAGLSARYDIRVLLPFLAGYDELRHWADFARQRLPAGVKLGAMVETPLAAFDLANWFDLVSFVAIGCNDLMQCLFAAERDRPELGGYLDPCAPALFRFMRQVAGGAGRRVGDVRLCGLLPQLSGVLPVLLGLGYRGFSVDPPVIPYLAQSVASLCCDDARRLADRVCACTEAAEAKRLLGVPW